MNRTAAEEAPQFAFSSIDPEARMGLPVGRNTNPAGFNSFLLGLILCGLLYLVTYVMVFVLGSASSSTDTNPSDTPKVWLYLTGFNKIPLGIAFLSCWSIALLTLKSLKIRAQRKALTLRMLPDDPGFILVRGTLDRVLEHIDRSIIGTDRFVLVHRVLAGLKSARNTGRIAETDSVIESIADSDESIMESGYTLVRGFIWAIPVLGFIGTILGLMSAIGRFEGLLPKPGSDVDTASLVTNLGAVISGLEEAFVTTGEALVCALCIQLFLTFVRGSDERFLDDCRRYTSKYILSRLRVDPDNGN